MNPAHNPWPFVEQPRAIHRNEEISKIVITPKKGDVIELTYDEPHTLEAPSGTILDHTGIGSNWVLPYEMPRVLKALTISAYERHTDWLGLPGCKYLGIRVDMRTGHFIITSDFGRVDGNDRVLSAFGLKVREDALVLASNS